MLINEISPSNFQAVFFDMDGLFLDSEPVWHAGETELMRELGYDWSEIDQLHCLGGPLSRISIYMSECVNGTKSPQWFLETIVSRMAKRLENGAPPMPGAMELSDELAANGMRHGLVSASPRNIVDSVLQGFDHHNFEISVAAGDIEKTKPFPDPYFHAAKLLSVDIKECLIFEDSETGIQAAKASGAFVVAVPHFIKVEPERRLKVISSLTEMSVERISNYYVQDKLS
jgi:HAD superfamily hydrolase (TIGR01509 family)